jgi:peptide/nickel transport system permease protein
LFAQPSARFAIGYLVFLVLLATLGATLMGPAAQEQHLEAARQAPSWSNGLLSIFGTNSLGQSVLARLIVGSQITLLVAFGSIAVAAIVGAILGAFAGYRSGLADTVLMRLADVILSFPSLLLAVVVLYLLGAGPLNLILVLGIARMPVFLRLARGSALEERSAQHVDAAKVMGVSDARILLDHILPAVARPVITVAALNVGLAMLLATSLTFLGIGIQPPAVSWGLMVAEGKDYLESAWWISFFPGLIILITTLVLNALSNSIAHATDPRMRGGSKKRKVVVPK